MSGVWSWLLVVASHRDQVHLASDWSFEACWNALTTLSEVAERVLCALVRTYRLGRRLRAPRRRLKPSAKALEPCSALSRGFAESCFLAGAACVR